MRRSEFLRRLGLGAVAAVAAPQVLEAIVGDPGDVLRDTEWEEVYVGGNRADISSLPDATFYHGVMSKSEAHAHYMLMAEMDKQLFLGSP